MTTDNTTQLTVTDPEDILAELEKAFLHIPFENSAYQNRAFVIAQQQTPGRAYRAIGLRMFAKIRALKEAAFGRQIEAIDIEELEAKIASEDTNEFDRRRAVVEIAKKKDVRAWTDKLAGDALAELSTLYSEFKKYPAYTRETFELEEAKHFKLRLHRQVETGGGALDSLAAMAELATFDDLLVEARAQLQLSDTTEPKP